MNNGEIGTQATRSETFRFKAVVNIATATPVYSTISLTLNHECTAATLTTTGSGTTTDSIHNLQSPFKQIQIVSNLAASQPTGLPANYCFLYGLYATNTATTPKTTFTTAPVFESLSGTTLTFGSSTANLIGTLPSVTRTYYAGGWINIIGKPLVYQTLVLTIYHECTSASINLINFRTTAFFKKTLDAITPTIPIKNYYLESAATVTGATDCFLYGFFDNAGTAIT